MVARSRLELTGTVLPRDGEATLATLRAPRAPGVRIATDDFGTNRSSPGRLRGFPSDKTKIDRRFVRDLGAHKAEKVRAALDRAGLSHRYLPSYSPDMNPIEQAWSKLKTRLRAVGARSKEALEAALGPALATITAQDARGRFRLAGYPAAD